MFVCSIPTEGAPSLRFLQGWVALPAPFAKCAKDRAPAMFVTPPRSEVWASRPMFARSLAASTVYLAHRFNYCFGALGWDVVTHIGQDYLLTMRRESD